MFNPVTFGEYLSAEQRHRTAETSVAGAPHKRCPAQIQRGWPCRQAQTELFMRFWTLSEAYLKATGEGLVGTTRDLEFTTDGLPQLISCAADQRELWQLGCAQGDRTDWLPAAEREAQPA